MRLGSANARRRRSKGVGGREASTTALCASVTGAWQLNKLNGGAGEVYESNLGPDGKVAKDDGRCVAQCNG